MTDTCAKGFTSITPSLSFKDCAKAIETYKQALGAKEISRLQMPETGGKIMHAVIEIGNSKLMVSDEFPGCPTASGTAFYLYVDDCDQTIQQAKKSGFEEKMPPMEMFWGDRMGAVSDPFGIQWSIATHKRDVTQDDLEKGAKEFIAQMKAA